MAVLESVPAHVLELHDASLTQDLLELRSRVAGVLLTKSDTVVVDVSDLTDPSSTALAALLWAKRNCSRGGVPFLIRGEGSRNREVLRRCGLLPTSAHGAR